MGLDCLVSTIENCGTKMKLESFLVSLVLSKQDLTK
jgi:hypothetical protein